MRIGGVEYNGVARKTGEEFQTTSLKKIDVSKQLGVLRVEGKEEGG